MSGIGGVPGGKGIGCRKDDIGSCYVPIKRQGAMAAMAGKRRSDFAKRIVRDVSEMALLSHIPAIGQSPIGLPSSITRRN